MGAGTKQIESFFVDGPAADELYLAMRDGEVDFQVAGRRRIEEMWQQCASVLDPDLDRKARNAFLNAWWELYVASTFATNGHPLIPRIRRVPAIDGPDVQTEDRVWIEAVVPGPGVGTDGVPIRRFNSGAHAVPDEQLKLRLRNAIEEKHKALIRYEERGWVKPNEPVIIAVSGSAMGYQWLELEIPRIIRAVLPIGHKVLHMEPKTATIVASSYEYVAAIKKASGSLVSTEIFASDSHSRISALIYSDSDPVNLPARPGADFVAVLNPWARAPLSRGFLEFMNEYWVVGDKLHRQLVRGA
jgi:hypothetical protein